VLGFTPEEQRQYFTENLKGTFLQSSLPGPPLKMASVNRSPKVKLILKQTHNLTTVFSNDPLGVALKLLSKGFISEETMSKMLVVSYTPTEKAAILIEAVRNKIELAPSKFTELIEILSEVACAKEVVESLRSTYQSELTSLVHYHTYQNILKSGRGWYT
jgi:hypothetical protein